VAVVADWAAARAGRSQKRETTFIFDERCVRRRRKSVDDKRVVVLSVSSHHERNTYKVIPLASRCKRQVPKVLSTFMLI